jgi:hypothetical protein
VRGKSHSFLEGSDQVIEDYGRQSLSLDEPLSNCRDLMLQQFPLSNIMLL